MRFRLGLAVGFGAGYYLGAKAGRERYEQMNRWINRAKESEAYETATEKAKAVVDLSPGGVRVATDERIPPGERAFVSLEIPGEVPVLAIADVVGEPFVVGGRHHVRLTFSMIGDDERGRLVRHLANGPNRNGTVSYANSWG